MEKLIEKKMNIISPSAKEIVTINESHGILREDPYHWLSDRDNPEVLKYIESENAYADALTENLHDLREQLFAEMKKRIDVSDESAPVRYGDYEYFTKTQPGSDYPVYFRRKNGNTETVLDQNKLAKGHAFCAIGAFKPSFDNKFLLYSVDFEGNELFEIHVKNLDKDFELDDILCETAGECEWCQAGVSFFYTTVDETHRPDTLMLHKIGTSPERDERLFAEENKAFNLMLDKPLSGDYLFVISASLDSTAVKYISLNEPSGDVKVLIDSKPGVEYYPDYREGSFYLRTNENALNFKIVYSPSCEPFEWKEFLPHSECCFLEDMIVFRDFIAVLRRSSGVSQAVVFDLDGTKGEVIPLPEKYASLSLYGNKMYDTDRVRVSSESFVQPFTSFDYIPSTGGLAVIKVKQVPDFYPEDYITERVYAPSEDGTMIPVTMFYRKGLEVKNNNPFFLIGYGAYGISYDPSFSVPLLSLADRGFICGIAHIRGGGDMGRQWYMDGKLLNKKNTFKDFISASEFLIKEGYTSAERLAAYGRSAGGLLMGSVMTMRPELFALICAEVPFVDALNTMLDETLPLTIGEYDEWGNPHKKEYYDYIRSYSPYDNLKETNYPNLFMFTALNDCRVMYWEPLKFIAKLRKIKNNQNLAVLKIDCCSGHRGASGRYDSLKEKAYQYALVLSLIKADI